jgi:hypothetical protein
VVEQLRTQDIYVPENLLKQKIESQLVEAAHSVRDRYKAGKCDAGEYEAALERLNDFLVDGKWPEYLQPRNTTEMSSADQLDIRKPDGPLKAR